MADQLGKCFKTKAPRLLLKKKRKNKAGENGRLEHTGVPVKRPEQ